MVDFAYEFKDLHQRLGYHTMILNNTLWINYQRMVVPIGPVNKSYSVSAGDCKELLRYFSDCVLVRSTTGFAEYPERWYCVIRDRHISLENMNSKDSRRQVRQGLENCLVRKIKSDTIKKEAWPVFLSAIKRYKHTPPTITKISFEEKIIPDEFENIFHYWGVFEKATGRLIAYTHNDIYENVEVNYAEVYYDPNFLRLSSGYALFYEMDKYYLENQKFMYVNDGFANLLHQTNIQEFLIRGFSYRKQPVGLNIHYRPIVGTCIRLSYPCRHVLGKISRPLAALYKQEEMSRF